MERWHVASSRVLGVGLTRRTVVGGLLASTASPASARWIQRHGGTVPVSAGRLLATYTFVNTSGSQQAANIPTDFIPLHFAIGDIPAGTAPVFKQAITGAIQPFSWGARSFYPDGSVRTACAILLPTFIVAGSGSQQVEIWSGGSPPDASGRTLTETGGVYDQSIIVNAALAVPSAEAGTWSAWVRSDSNNLEQFVYLDGAAGKCWRILTNFAQTIGGTAHSRLVCYHYITALNNSSGGLGGFTYLPRITQPYYSDAPSKAKLARAFTSINWQHGAGPTTVNFTFPQQGSKTFTWGAGTPTTSTAHNYYIGSSDFDTVGCMFSGSLPTTSPQINTTGLFYLGATGGSNTQFRLATASNWFSGGSGNISVTAGAGSATVIPVNVCNTFGSIFSPVDDTNLGPLHNWFQGSGSLTARTTLRCQIDTNYLHHTRLMPPYDLSLTVADNPTWNYAWSPCSIGECYEQDQPTGFGPGQIGWFTKWARKHLSYQTANNEKRLRTVGYAAANKGISFRDSTNRNLPNYMSSTYTGVGGSSWSAVSSTVSWNGTSGGGFTAPGSDDLTFSFGSNIHNHQPEFAYWAYLRFGEPQFLDLCLEMGNATIGGYGSSDREPAAIAGGYKAQVTNWGNDSGQVRTLGWSWRDVVHAAVVAPGSYNGITLAPDGSQIAKYFYDVVAGNAARTAGIVTTGNYNAWMANAGFWQPVTADYGSPVMSQTGNMWERGYIMWGFALANSAFSGLQAGTDAGAFLSREATWLNYWYNHFGNSAWGLAAFYLVFWTSFAGGSNAWPPVTDDVHFAWNGPMVSGGLSWTNSNPAFFIDDGQCAGGWTPIVNDWGIFNANITPPTGFSTFTPYYIRDVTHVSGRWHFNLAATSSSNPAIIPSNTGVAGDQFCNRMVTPPAPNSPGSIMNNDYFQLQRGIVKMIKALGLTPALTLVETDLDTRYTTAGFDPDDPNLGSIQFATRNSYL